MFHMPNLKACGKLFLRLNIVQLANSKTYQLKRMSIKVPKHSLPALKNLFNIKQI